MTHASRGTGLRTGTGSTTLYRAPSPVHEMNLTPLIDVLLLMLFYRRQGDQKTWSFKKFLLTS